MLCLSLLRCGKRRDLAAPTTAESMRVPGATCLEIVDATLHFFPRYIYSFLDDFIVLRVAAEVTRAYQGVHGARAHQWGWIRVARSALESNDNLLQDGILYRSLQLALKTLGLPE